MATWILGDIHGCADELAQLVDQLQLGPDDRLWSCGDLFHRGPDPVGVMEVLRAHGARFILGNHERAVLERVGLAPKRADARDRPPLRERFPDLDPQDLAGDGGEPCEVDPQRRVEILHYLQQHDGYFATDASIEGAGPTRDGRPWWLVHAGVEPDRAPAECSAFALTRIRRMRGRNAPWWYELHRGPELVLFGHSAARKPIQHRVRGRLLALGLDTGCVYGGTLTAYSPELDEFASVRALRAWAA